MKIEMILGIHFHQQDEVSIFLESNGKGNDEKNREILIFCSVALRILFNLGNDHAAYSLAKLLEQSEGSLSKEFADHKSPEGAKLVKDKGILGQKRFEAQLKFIESENYFNFQFHPKGFGFFGRDIGYYSLTAVIMLLKYLTKKRVKDKDFLNKLSVAARMCGEFFNSGQLSLTNQNQAALTIATQAYEGESNQDMLLTSCGEYIQRLDKIISKNFREYIEKSIEDELFAHIMKSGYALRYAEQKLANKPLKKASGEILTILESKMSKKGKIEKLANHFDNHSRLDLGEIVKPYSLLDFDEVNNVFLHLVEHYLNYIMGKLQEGNKDLLRELSYRNAAFGYAYKVAEELVNQN